MHQKNNKNNVLIISNIISWCICLMPLVLIFSNSIADIIAVGASFFFIFLSVKNNNWLWLKEPWVKICLAIYFWLIITSFFAYNVELAFSRSISWVRFVIFAASLQFFFLNNKKNIDRLIFCTLIALIYVNIEMLIEKFAGYSLYSELRELLFESPKFAGGPSRLSGPFKDAPKSGIFLAYFIFPTILGVLKMIKKKLSYNFLLILLLSFLIINIYLIFESGHRSSILSIFISFIAFMVYFFWNKKKIIIFAITIFFVGTFLYNSNLNNIKGSTYYKTIEEIKNYSNSSYGSLSLTAFKMFKHHPIFGIGLKNYRVACEKDEFLSKGHLGSGYGVSPWKGHYNEELKKHYEATCSSHPHNLYLTWLAETGLIGFLLFIFFIVTTCKKILKNKRIISNQIVALGILLSLFPKLLPMMPSLNIFSNWNAICFWLLIGWLLSFFPKNTSEKNL